MEKGEVTFHPQDEDKKTRRNCCKRLLDSWQTTQMSRISVDEDVRVVLREFFIYCLFLATVLIAAFGMLGHSRYYFTKVMENLFISEEMKEIKTINTFWKYTEIDLPEKFFSDDIVAAEDEQKILNENKLLGTPRIRQIKVRPNSCIINENFRRSFTSCYAPYSLEAEDVEPFGLAQGTAWNYSTEEELNGESYWGQIATYGGGGYYQDLPVTTRPDMQEVLEVLSSNEWIRRGTRAVFVDFTVYNANVNLFCMAKLVFEMPPTGGVLPSWKFTSAKLLRYVTKFDYFVLGCELMVVSFIIFYTLEEIREVIYFKLQYFFKMWNLLDLLIIMISYACIAISIYRTSIINQKLHRLIEYGDEYPNFEVLNYWETKYNNMIGIVVFFVWIKIFKFIKFNKTMNQLSMTLSKCSKDILGFSVMFFIVFLGFAQLGYILFGNEVATFRTVVTASFTLLRTILGDFDYDSITRVDRIVGPVYFLSFIFFVFFILLNVFLAIITDTYSEVKSETESSDIYNMGQFLWRGIRNILEGLHLLKKKDRATIENKDILTGRKLRYLLEIHNFTDSEIDAFQSKYGIDDEDKEITPDDALRILEDMQNKPPDDIFSQPTTSHGPHISVADFNVLQRRVEVVEISVKALLPRVLEVIGNVEYLLHQVVPRE